MTTQKDFSSVFFGNPAHLKVYLEEKVSLGELSNFMMISHFNEAEELQNHCHFFCSPARRIDLDSFRKVLKNSEDGALPCRKADISNWLLYSLHDDRYLELKGLHKKFNYSLKHIISSFDDVELAQLKSEAYEQLLPRYNVLEWVKESFHRGCSWESVITAGIIPPNQWQYYREIYNALKCQGFDTSSTETNKKEKIGNESQH